MSQKNIIIIVVVTLLVLVLAGLVYKNIKSEVKNTASAIEKSSDFSRADSSQTVSGNIYFSVNQDGVFEIKTYDLAKKESKTVFTDKDEDFKLTAMGSYAYLSSEYLVFEKKGSQGRLALINFLDHSNKKVIFDNFTKPESLAISPDGQTIFFSNSNLLNGSLKYYLYQISRNHQNLRQFYESDQPIKNIVSNKNGNEVAFIQNDERIIAINLESLKQKEIFHSGGKIAALVWYENGGLVLAEAKDKKFSLGKILTCDENGNNLKKVLETKSSFPDTPIVSPDFLATAYVLKNFTESYDSGAGGEANFTLIGDEVANKIGSGNSIIAWVE